MKNPKTAIVFTAILTAITVTGWIFYTGFSADASGTGFWEALGNIPADYHFLVGVNVQKFVASPAYVRITQKQSPLKARELDEFVQRTGVDPARDVSYMIAAAGAGSERKEASIAIVVGRFNEDAIKSYVRTKFSPAELQYAGHTVFTLPESAGRNGVQKGIAFLSDHKIALGDLESIKAALDVSDKGARSILSDPIMTTVLDGISPDEMFWFAGDATEALSRAPVTHQFGFNTALIQSVVGVLDLNQSAVGKITVTAVDEDSAKKVGDVVKGFVALAQLAAEKNSDLKTLVQGLKFTQNAAQVSLEISFPLELLQKLEQQGRMPKI